jgi:AraC family transcriptional activator of pobA
MWMVRLTFSLDGKSNKKIKVAKIPDFLDASFFIGPYSVKLKGGNVQKLEEILNNYFNNEESLMKGIPTIQYLSEILNISPGYLSDMLRSLTGRNAQQHIHSQLIDKAKEKLSTTSLSVSEIAYALGFEHPQSFSKLFKTKTKLSPLEFRQSFN